MMRIFLALAITSACWAQAEFDVASVKPNHSMDSSVSITRRAGGVFSANNVSLQMLITFAYDIRPHQLSGGPGWMDSDHYDILATPSPQDAAAEGDGRSDAAGERLRQRVRALLADRFKLVVHSDTRELPILALVLAKNGAHLEESKSDGPQIQGQKGQLTCKKVSMKMFAERVLSQRMGRSVVDKTGLAGDFDFEFKYAEDRGAAATADVSGPDFLSAMQEQLGLKLESQKGPVQVIVIDHAERATAN